MEKELKAIKSEESNEILNNLYSQRNKHNWLNNTLIKHSSNIKAILENSSLLSLYSIKNQGSNLENWTNLYLCLFQVFFINMSYTSSLTSYKDLIADIDSSFLNIGFIISLNTFSELIFMFILAYLPALKDRLSFNAVNLVFLISYLIYILSYIFKSLFLVALSRFIMGILGGEMFSRQYLLNFHFKNNRKAYISAYLGLIFFGLASGLLIDLFSSKLFELEAAEILLYSNNWGAAVGMIIYSIFSLIGFWLFKSPIEKPFEIFEETKTNSANSNEEPLLLVQRSKGITSNISNRSKVILLLVIFSIKALSENNLVSSLIISDQFYQEKDSKPYKTLIISLGFVLVIPIVAISKIFLSHLKHKQIIVLTFVLIIVGVISSSSFLAECKYAYGEGFIIIFSFVHLLELNLALLFQIQTSTTGKNLFLNSTFMFTLTIQTAKIIGSNLTDTLQFISNYNRLNEIQSVANLMLSLFPLILFVVSYKNLI